MTDNRISTGNVGLDAVLRGGLPCNRLYLVEGSPGSGKTTLALQFLLEGRKGEQGLYITLAETKDELQVVAGSHGWNLEAIELFELASVEDVLGPGRDQSIVHSWEMELGVNALHGSTRRSTRGGLLSGAILAIARPVSRDDQAAVGHLDGLVNDRGHHTLRR
jgi:circadian clock protein KaiC